MILNIICNDYLVLGQLLLMDRIILISLYLWNFLTDILIQIIFFKDQGDHVLPFLEVINSSNIVLKIIIIGHLQMITSNW